MKTKKITRNQIIKAIKTEPLAPGKWITPIDDRYGEPASKRECVVCAVGGVLRSTFKQLKWDGVENLAEDLTIGDTTFPWETSEVFLNETISLLLKEKRWFNALSVKFEALSKEIGLAECAPRARGSKRSAVRRRLIPWVKENFPTSIEIEVDE